MTAGPLLVDGGLGLAEQLGHHQQIQQLQAVVDRPGLQVGDSRHQRGELSRVPCRRSAWARTDIPYRARSTTRRCGTCASRSSAPTLTPAISAARFSALSRFRPLGFDGPLRQRSRSEYRDPVRHHHQLLQAAPLVRAGQARQRRVQLLGGLLPDPATSRASVVTPGSSTALARSHRTPSAKMVLGPCPVFHARDRAHCANSASASENSRQPVGGLDLLAMLERRVPPLGVPLHA